MMTEKLLLAPMEGVTTYIYRKILNKYFKGIDTFYTPFLSNTSFSHRELMDVLPDNNQGMHVIPQILANNSDTFLTIASKLKDFGYSEVNLNLGCPSGTVVAKKRGSGMLSDLKLLDTFLNDIYENCDMDISIKTRIGVDSLYEWEDILKIYAKYPIKNLIVHPRLQVEFYKGSVHTDEYNMTTDCLKCPVFYNGDITSTESFDRIKSNLTVAPEAYMVGRGIIANPNLISELKGTTQDNPKEIFRAFHNELLNAYTEVMSGDMPVLFKMKELWAFMGPAMNVDAKVLKKIRKARNLVEYRNLFI